MQSEDDSKLNRLNPVGDKPLIGAPLGKFRVIIRAAGQMRHTELQGDVFDATDLFGNDFIVGKFKKVVCDEISTVHKIVDMTPIYEENKQIYSDKKNPVSTASTVEANETALSKTKEAQRDVLEEAVCAFRAFPLGKVCRVLILKEDFSSDKHIILQFGRLRMLTEYASMPHSLGRTLLHGGKVLFSVTGWGLSLPTRRMLPDNLGKGYIHWIIPDDPNHGSKAALEAMKDANTLTDILPYIPQTVKHDEYKKSKDAQVKAAEDACKEMTATVQAKSVENDFYHRVIAAFQRHKTLETPTKGHDFMDFVFYAVPTVLLYFIGSSFGDLGAIGGLILGLLSGGFLSYRRK